MLRVLVVDERVDVRQAFAAVLDGQPDLQVVAQAGSLADASTMLEGVETWPCSTAVCLTVTA